MNKINIQELTEIVAQEGKQTKKFSDQFLRELVNVISEYLQTDGFVKVKGLGTFKIVKIEARKSIDVTTGKEIVLPARNKVQFVPEDAVKQQINAPYSHLQTTIVGDSASSEPVAPKSEPETQLVTPTVESSKEEPVEVFKPAIELKPVNPAAQAKPVEPAKPAEQVVVIPILPTEDKKPTEPEKSVEEVVLAEETHSVVVEQPVESEIKPSEENPSKEETHVKETPVEEKKGFGAGWWVLQSILLLAIIVAILYAFVDWDSFLNKSNGTKFDGDVVKTESSVPLSKIERKPLKTVEQAEEQPSEVVTTVDSVAGEQPSSEVAQESVVENKSAEPKKFDIRSYNYKMATEYPVREVVTVIDGSRLTMVAYRAYGDKIFWVYVYDANRDVLKSPSGVSTGMQLKIADLPAELTDPNNPEAIAFAKELVKKYDK